MRISSRWSTELLLAIRSVMVSLERALTMRKHQLSKRLKRLVKEASTSLKPSTLSRLWFGKAQFTRAHPEKTSIRIIKLLTWKTCFTSAVKSIKSFKFTRRSSTTASSMKNESWCVSTPSTRNRSLTICRKAFGMTKSSEFWLKINQLPFSHFISFLNTI